MSTIIVYCKACGKKNRAPAAALGKTGKCSQCGEHMEIRSAGEPDPLALMSLQTEPSATIANPEPAPTVAPETSQRLRWLAALPVVVLLTCAVAYFLTKKKSAQPKEDIQASSEISDKKDDSGKQEVAQTVRMSPEFDPDVVMENEYAVIAALRVIDEAQDIYHRTDWDRDSQREFAASIAQLHDQVEPKTGKPLQLVGKELAQASKAEAVVPCHGYFFRLIAEQPPNANERFKEDGQLTKGFAVVAWPAEYGKTGTHTFVLEKLWRQTKIFEMDLGNRPDHAQCPFNVYEPKADWKELGSSEYSDRPPTYANQMKDIREFIKTYGSKDLRALVMNNVNSKKDALKKRQITENNVKAEILSCKMLIAEVKSLSTKESNERQLLRVHPKMTEADQKALNEYERLLKTLCTENIRAHEEYLSHLNSLQEAASRSP